MYSILIVDDERIERSGIEMLIKRMALPLCPEQAENGEVALRMLRQKHYDLLLTDIKMPFMDGLTLSHEARQLYPDLVVLIFSAYSDFEKAQKAIREQVYRYLLKPVDVQEFKTVLSECISDIERARAAAQERARLQESLERYRRREARLLGRLGESGGGEIPTEQVKALLNGEEGDAPEGAENPVIQKVLEIIHDEYMDDIGLEAVARRVCLTPGYLSTLFRQQTGQSYIKYLNNYRLEVAARLLTETHTRVSAVAQQVGFPGESYFITLFRQRYGLTPRNYRMKLGVKDE